MNNKTEWKEILVSPVSKILWIEKDRKQSMTASFIHKVQEISNVRFLKQKKTRFLFIQ